MNDREKWRERVRDIRATSTTWWWWWCILKSWKFFSSTSLLTVSASTPHSLFSFLFFFFFLNFFFLLFTRNIKYLLVFLREAYLHVSSKDSIWFFFFANSWNLYFIERFSHLSKNVFKAFSYISLSIYIFIQNNVKTNKQTNKQQQCGPSKLSSDDDSGFKDSFGAKASLPKVQSLCRILWYQHTLIFRHTV